MSNPNFIPDYSSNWVYRDQDYERCLTDDLDAMDASIAALQTGKANTDHTHDGYSAIDHTHDGYAPATHTHTGFAAETHTHTQYAPTSHSHDYAATSHEHEIGDVSGLQDALDGKSPTSHSHSGYAASGHNHDTKYAAKTHTHDYAASGHSHSYNDLSDKPTIPDAYTHPSSHPASMITGLSDVATSGSYNDLTNKPTIPTIPASLPANGGNADTVDNKHASDFAAASHTHPLSAVTGLLDLLMTAEDGNVKNTITGDILAVIKGWAIGVYTAYSMGGSTSSNTNMPKTSESWRYLVHKTGANFGWVLAFGSSGSIYSNYIDSGTWQGWKAIYDASPDPLWAPSGGTGGYYMTAIHTVTPSKKLSQCRNGWLLLWSDYNADSSEAADYDWHCSIIPKIHPNGGNWAGHSWLFDIPHGMQSTSPYTTETRHMKWLYVYDNKLTGHDANNQNGRNDCVLRAVYEF